MHGFDVHESGKTWHGRTSQKYPSILKRQQSRERREVSWIWGKYIFITFWILLTISTTFRLVLFYYGGISYEFNKIRIKAYIT